MELISVIVPIYQVEPYLDRCIESIVNQTYRQLEIILVDDGSPDRCPEICDSWAEKDGRIRVIHKPNGGLSDARNAGMSIANGEYVGFIDSDDWIEADFFERLYNAILDYGADVAECAVKFVDEHGAILRVRDAAPEPRMGHIDALRRLVLEDGVYQTVWNKLYRREVIQGILFETGKYKEDEFWTDQVLDRVRTLATVGAPLYNYLQRRSSIIGTGYNLRRLDGLEARFQRMQRLQKYSDLAALSRERVMLDCMWHLQCAYRCLQGEAREEAVNKVMKIKGMIPRVPQRDLSLNWKYRIWYALFEMAPKFTARLRNAVRIGL